LSAFSSAKTSLAAAASDQKSGDEVTFSSSFWRSVLVATSKILLELFDPADQPLEISL
jgi:hypothetical protein